MASVRSCVTKTAEIPDRGRIQFGGETWLDAEKNLSIEPQARRVGYVSQDPALFPHLTVRDNIAFGLGRLNAVERSARVNDVMGLLDFADLAARYPRELSGGQAQRVAIARAIAPKPRLLLLDEPLAALDAPTRGRLRRDLRAAIARSGITALFVTHDRTEAIELGDRMAVLAGGRIRQVGPVLDVFRRPADLVVAQSVGVESVIPGEIERIANGLVEVRVGNAIVRAVESDEHRDPQDVFVCIRAEDVLVQRTASESASARNHFAGHIVSIEPEGPLERVTIECGFPLVALITRNAREEMELTEGADIVAAVKATAVHLVVRTQEHVSIHSTIQTDASPRARRRDPAAGTRGDDGG